MTRWDQARQLLRLKRRRPDGVPGGVSTQDRAPAPVGGASSGPPRSAGGGVSQDATGAGQAGSRDRRPVRRARSLCIASGKGGTGKSSVSSALAALFQRRGKTLLLDGDLGCANAHILQDVHPESSFADVITGDVGIADIVTPCRNGVDLLAGGSGVARLAGLRTYEIQMIGRGLERLEPAYDHLVIDSAAGLSRQTVAFAVASDVTLVVTTPDVTAMTDAYAFLKVFVRQCLVQGIERPMPYLVVNRADPIEAEHVARRLQDVVAKFLGRSIEFIGSLPEDRAAFRCTQRRTTVVEGEPDSELARALQSLSTSVLGRLARVKDSAGAGSRLADSADDLA